MQEIKQRKENSINLTETRMKHRRITQRKEGHIRQRKERTYNKLDKEKKKEMQGKLDRTKGRKTGKV